VALSCRLQPRGLHDVPSSGDVSISKPQKLGRDHDDEDAPEIVEVAHSPGGANEESALTTYPDGGVRAWLVVVGSTAVLTSTYGLMTAGGLFLTFWKESQLAEYTETEIAWIIAMFVFLDSLVSGPAGLLFDKFGAQRLLFPCGLIYGFSFLGLSFSTTYAHFMTCFVVGGIFGGE